MTVTELKFLKILVSSHAYPNRSSYLYTLFLEHTDDLFEVNVEGVKEGPLGRQVLDNQRGTGLVDVGGERVPALPRLARVAERQNFGHQENLMIATVHFYSI